jgi:hypothetical protein
MKGDDLDNYYARRERHGPSYHIVPSERDPAEDGTSAPHGVPDGYEHPLNLRGLNIEGAPRALPVSQQLQDGPERNRDEVSEAAARQAAADLAAYHG